MPTLTWVGKEDVINHHKHVPLRLLKPKGSGVISTGNMLVEGDNLEALKSLIPYYKGKIKCIYIDPPYNTGNECWAYNDNVNSPTIQKWLGNVVDAEDLSKSDKWLCMMYPRLRLLRELLSSNGLLFVSINYNEVEHLAMLLNEIFGKNNFRNSIVVKRGTSNIQSQFPTVVRLKGAYESVLVYSKRADYKIPKPLTKVNEEKCGSWNNHWRSTDRKNLRYTLFGIKPKTGTWRWSEKRSLQAIKNYKMLLADLKSKNQKITPENIDCWYLEKIGSWPGEKIDLLRKSKSGKPEHFVPPNRPEIMTDVWSDISSNGSRQIKKFLSGNFENPKSVELVKRIISVNMEKDDIILDSFSGSGTTAHAVLELNKEDGGNRKFILIEMEKSIVKDITTKRIRAAAKFLKCEKNAGFTHCVLANVLFDNEGMLNPKCTFEHLARHIFLYETGSSVTNPSPDTHFVGKYDGVRFYLLFGDKNNTLSIKKLKSWPKQESKIIYADSCTISDAKLKQWNATFKHIPYEVRTW